EVQKVNILLGIMNKSTRVRSDGIKFA
ncbi:MAG: hypothetical protein RL037_2193, partial [Bacteroidota bacterium]